MSDSTLLSRCIKSLNSYIDQQWPKVEQQLGKEDVAIYLNVYQGQQRLKN